MTSGCVSPEYADNIPSTLIFGALWEYPRHIVAAGALITKGETVLLVKTPRRGWEIPGGQIEENEGVLQGVRREIMEESNIRAKITALAGVYSNLADPCKIIFDFIGESESGETATSDETLEVE